MEVIFEIILIFTGIVLSLVGIAGCVIPGIPGPPLNFIALILLELIYPDEISGETLLWFFLITVLVTILDYVLPSYAGKYFGISRSGVWGSFAGMVLGIFFFPPAGMIAGIIIGAVAGELIAGKSESEALRAGGITFILSIFMMILKLGTSVLMTFFFIIGVI
ncbi:MAG: DUF456 domain-containing protein [Ignavibacteriaceae bacterium]